MAGPSSFFEIRRIASGDVEMVRRFFDDVARVGLDRTFHPHPFTADTALGIGQQSGMDWYAGCFVHSVASQRMVGYVLLRGWDGGDAIPSFGVCVLPEYQGLGLGRTLLDLAIAVARFRGSAAVRLRVFPDNLPALSLYQSAGFEFKEDLEQGQMVAYLQL